MTDERSPRTPPRTPRRRKRRKRPVVAAPSPAGRSPGSRIGVAILGAAAATALAAWAWLFVLYPGESGPGEGRPAEVTVPAGTSPEALTRLLTEAGVVARPRLFALWVRLSGGTGHVVAGAHLLSDDATPRQIMARLERRPTAGTVRVTFPEGWTRFDMAKRLQDKHVTLLRAFLDATTDPALLHELGIEGDSAEGFLFPATYELPLDGDARDVVRKMKREFDRRWDLLSLAHPASLTDVMTSAVLDQRSLVTLASMVEKEAVADEERPIIAGVFLNRLRDPSFRPKHLECDPTASYGCVVAPERAPSCAGFSGKATAAIEHDPENPYSTYTHEGLPPGPIANPGARSLEAAMNPSSTHYFFFVARGDGHHAFSETYQAHTAAVRMAAGRLAAGEGR